MNIDSDEKNDDGAENGNSSLHSPATTIIFCMPGVWPQADNPNGWKEEERETGLNQHQKSQLNFYKL